MDSFFKATSYNISTDSESTNEIGSNIKFNTAEIDFNQTFSSIQTSLASNLPCQTSNNSLSHFKKLKRKNTIHDSESQQTNKYSTSPYSLKSLGTKRRLPESKNVSNCKTKLYNFKKSNSISSYNNLNKEFTHAAESSSDTDFPDLKLISINKETSTSPVTKKKGQHIAYTSLSRKKCPTVINNKRNKYFESSTSSDSSFDFSQINIDSVNSKTKTNNELNLDEILLDCSLSDVLVLRKDDGDKNSPSYSSAAIDTSHLIKLTPPQSPVTSNVSFGISDDTPPQKPSNVIINIPDFVNDENNDEQRQIKIDEQNGMLNIEHFDVNQPNLLSNDVNLKEPESRPKLKLNSYSFIRNVSSEPSCTLKNDSKNADCTISETKNKKKKFKKSKHSHLVDFFTSKTSVKVADVLKNKSHNTIKTKNDHSKNITTQDIGLQYNTDEDNYMVELPNGAVVPAFLSTLKPKDVRKLCICGLTKEEVPEYWSESFHSVLHLNFYKLCFIGNLPEKNIINHRHNDLLYRIVLLNVNDYSNENIKKTIKNVDDFVCLEYGIPKINTHSFKHSTYLAVLPNSKVIGYLEIEPIQNACKLTYDEKYSENIMPAKFGVSKIWVLIKHRNKNVDINLLETFRKKENLQKKDMAFSVSGCQSVEFVKQYIGNDNILVYI